MARKLQVIRETFSAIFSVTELFLFELGGTEKTDKKMDGQTSYIYTRGRVRAAPPVQDMYSPDRQTPACQSDSTQL